MISERVQSLKVLKSLCPLNKIFKDRFSFTQVSTPIDLPKATHLLECQHVSKCFPGFGPEHFVFVRQGPKKTCCK